MLHNTDAGNYTSVGVLFTRLLSIAEIKFFLEVCI